MKRAKRVWLSGIAALIALAITVAFAPQLRADDEGNPDGTSARAVRLSSVDGEVRLDQGGQSLTDHAVANTPLFEGTLVSTGSDGRAEVQFEDGSVARIPPDSALLLSVLRPGETELDLNSGMGYFELQGSESSGPMRVRFGSSVATASGFTVFRVKLDEGPASVAVFSGNAHLRSGDGSEADVHGGQSASAEDSSSFDVAESIEPDSWDAWNSDRDQALSSSEEAAAPSEDIPNNNNPAWGDLNSNGTWYNVPDQGYVWSPYEASNAGWDPYGTGYWVWTPGYGYVWVSGEPWGYMPYQCGAWNYYDTFGWGWAPGACQTWWGGGGGVWVVNVVNPPRWYRMPNRPTLPRPSPPPHPGRPVDGVRMRAFGKPAQPIIPVNRTSSGGVASGFLPPRDKGAPVIIAGSVVQPVRPVAVRPRYSSPVITRPPNTSAPVTSMTARPGYVRRPEPGDSRINSARPMPAPVIPTQQRPAPVAPRPAPEWHPAPMGGHSSPPPAAPSRPATPPPPPPSHSAPPATHSAPASNPHGR